MKVAILLAGPYRGNDEIKANHLKSIGDYDTYVSCFNHYKADWLNSRWKIKKLYTTPLIDITTTKWYEHRNNIPGQSGFWQFWNLKNVIESIEEDYDWYIKSRCDLNFNNETISEYFLTQLEPNTFHCPDKYFDQQDWIGTDRINDQFFICDKTVIKVISEFVIGYYDNPSKLRPFEIEGNEMALKKWLEENEVTIKPFYNFSYTKNHNGYDKATGEGGVFQLEKL